MRTPPRKSDVVPFNDFKGQTLVELLQHRARVQPTDMAYTYLADGEADERKITFSELDHRARAVAAHLEKLGLRRQPVLLQMETSLEFLVAFFGCMHAGAIAVPAHVHRSRRALPRLESIVADAGITAVLTTQSVLDDMRLALKSGEALESLCWVPVESIHESLADQWLPPEVGPETPAFLQYTSGSTSEPKGVIVTHGSILSNERMIQAGFGRNRDSLGVAWLPLFHDMGLIGHVLQTLYSGSGSILMSPMHFLEKPVRWLKAISRYGGHTTGGGRS
jgi:acyl-CoA synthetase (AMP-forming)/AMP-acid ligase II